MSAFDRVCRAAGIAICGSALAWMVSCGVVFLVEDAHHQRAAFGLAAPHSGGGWIVAPILLSAASIGVGIITSITRG